MNPHFADKEIIHECQDIVAKYRRLMENEVAAKLADLQTMDVAETTSEFSETMKGAVGDVLADTLDYWASDLNDAEQEFRADLAHEARRGRTTFNSFPWHAMKRGAA